MDSGLDWGFIVFVGTMLFFAALHQWPPDGRRWQREELKVKDEMRAAKARRAKELSIRERSGRRHTPFQLVQPGSKNSRDHAGPLAGVSAGSTR